MEEIDEEKTKCKVIILRPDTYIGSIEKCKRTSSKKKKKVEVPRPIAHIPGLCKTLNELLRDDADVEFMEVATNVGQKFARAWESGDGEFVIETTDARSSGKLMFIQGMRYCPSPMYCILTDNQDGVEFRLAFSKKKMTVRKIWLTNSETGTESDPKDKVDDENHDLVYKELTLYSMAHLQRSIPSVVDGLIPSQREILSFFFKLKLDEETTVLDLWCSDLPIRSKHHIISMAQNFVGSNNINLLQPRKGRFGTRLGGGHDVGDAMFLLTMLSPITRYLFLKESSILPKVVGQPDETSRYMPVIPTVLVNGQQTGSKGGKSGLSTYIPKYNPVDIIKNIWLLLNDKELEPMHPWYRGFKGKIEKSGEGVYTVSGTIEDIKETSFRITELPLGKWTDHGYSKFLRSMRNTKNKLYIEGFTNRCRANVVDFEVRLSQTMMHKAKTKGLEKTFRLTTTISTTNMHLFDSEGMIKKYDTPEQILNDFYLVRRNFYEKRKQVPSDSLLSSAEKNNQADNSVKMLWMKDLKAFLQNLIEQYPSDAQAGKSLQQLMNTEEAPRAESVHTAMRTLNRSTMGTDVAPEVVAEPKGSSSAEDAPVTKRQRVVKSVGVEVDDGKVSVAADDLFSSAEDAPVSKRRRVVKSVKVEVDDGKVSVAADDLFSSHDPSKALERELSRMILLY